LLDEIDDFLGVGFFNWQVPEGDIGAFASESDGRSAPNAGIAAGDQRTTARESSRTFTAFFTMIGRGCIFKVGPGGS
jgi:hypothetical protein